MEPGVVPGDDDLLIGDICELHSLSRHEYNGKVGRIISDLEDGRFRFWMLDDNVPSFRVKPENLTRTSRRYKDEYAALQRNPEIQVLRKSWNYPEKFHSMRSCASIFITETSEGDLLPVTPDGLLGGPSQNEVERAEEGSAVRRWGLAAVLWAEGLRRKDTRMLAKAYEIDDVVSSTDLTELVNVLKEHDGSKDDADVLLLRAVALECYQYGDPKQAVEAALASSELLARGCTIALAQFLLGSMAQMQGKSIPHGAVKACKKLLKLNPVPEKACVLIVRAETNAYEVGEGLPPDAYARRLELAERVCAAVQKDSSRRRQFLANLIVALAAKDGTGQAERGRIAELWGEMERYDRDFKSVWGKRPAERVEKQAQQVVLSLGLVEGGSPSQLFAWGQRLFTQAWAVKRGGNLLQGQELMGKAVQCFQDARCGLQGGLGALRFGLGDRVFCNTGEGDGLTRYCEGEVIQLWYRESQWPHDKPSAPYQVRLRDGRKVWAPEDHEAFVRAERESLLWEIYQCEAQAHHMMLNHTQAYECYRSGANVDPFNSEAWLNWAVDFQRLQEYETDLPRTDVETVESILKKGLQLLPGDAKLLEMLAKVQAAGGGDASRQAHQRATELASKGLENLRILEEEQEVLLSMRRCALPGCGVRMEKSKLKMCSRCRLVRYCGADHQKEHWKAHKKTCIPFE